MTPMPRILGSAPRLADVRGPEHEVLARVAALRREIEELDSALRMKALQR